MTNDPGSDTERIRRLRRDLDRLKQGPRNVRPNELHRVLTRAGFERRFGKGDHWVYEHPAQDQNLAIDPRNPVRPAYVRDALRAIEEVMKYEGH